MPSSAKCGPLTQKVDQTLKGEVIQPVDPLARIPNGLAQPTLTDTSHNITRENYQCSYN